MAKTIAPLLSIGAKGQLGKSVVYSSWKGIKTAKQYVIPANPSTVKQVAVRNAMRWVHDAYKYLPAIVQQPWVLYAKGQPMTPANAWQQANQSIMIGATKVDAIVFTKPTNSGPPPTSVTATPGSGQVTIAGVAPTLITGWTVTNFIGIAMQDVVPSGEMEMVISSAGESATSPYSVVLTGLLHTQKYVCGGFFQYLRADGKVAYSSSINEIATTT